MILPVAILVAIGIVVFLRKARYNYERLPRIPYVTGASLPEVAVIIPARNEAHQIGRAIAGFPEDAVIVVDDHSTDGTRKAAEAAGVTVIQAPALPEGALGKPNACQAGAEAAGDVEWLLFVDADTNFARVFLPSLIEYARHEDLEMVSVFLRQETVTLAEKAILPYAFALYFTGVNAARVNGRPPSEWLANGQCLLVKKEAYEIMGGHKAVLDSVIEDVALARLAARKGVRTRVVRAEHMGTVRMYDSLGAIFRGFEKNSFRFLRINPATGGFVIVSSILLTTWLPVLMWLLWAHLYRQAAIFAVIPSLILLPWYRGASALLAPVAIYLFQGIALSAMWKNLTGRKTEWKGRAV